MIKLLQYVQLNEEISFEKMVVEGEFEKTAVFNLFDKFFELNILEHTDSRGVYRVNQQLFIRFHKDIVASEIIHDDEKFDFLKFFLKDDEYTMLNEMISHEYLTKEQVHDYMENSRIFTLVNMMVLIPIYDNLYTTLSKNDIETLRKAKDDNNNTSDFDIKELSLDEMARKLNKKKN